MVLPTAIAMVMMRMNRMIAMSAVIVINSDDGDHRVKVTTEMQGMTLMIVMRVMKIVITMTMITVTLVMMTTTMVENMMIMIMLRRR